MNIYKKRLGLTLCAIPEILESTIKQSGQSANELLMLLRDPNIDVDAEFKDTILSAASHMRTLGTYSVTHLLALNKKYIEKEHPPLFEAYKKVLEQILADGGYTPEIKAFVADIEKHHERFEMRCRIKDAL